MPVSVLEIMDLVGTIAFALSGAFVAVHKSMDIFGVNILAIMTACGGGMIRDLVVGNIPPAAFRNPFYVIIAAIVANILFLILKLRRRMPHQVASLYDRLFFWFDTLGLAAFTVDGIMVGMNAGYDDNTFLIVFLGFITGVGGGVLRDMMANQMPDILRKHVYAMASIIGSLLLICIYDFSGSKRAAMYFGFAAIIIIRYLADRFKWDLPKV